MANKMLIDAAHPEETRVVVVRGNRVEEFDFEAANRKQLRGNIYLAKVTRVEPSLQAAFVEYGGNRHGFLAFSEIHPDYYQIPVADRQALLDAEASEAGNGDDDTEEKPKRRPRRRSKAAANASDETVSAPVEDGDGDTQPSADAASETPEDSKSEDGQDANQGDEAAAAQGEADASESDGDADHDVNSDNDASDDESDEDQVESVGAEDAMEEVPVRRQSRRQYKIQEVIKRRQVILVQVVKEERGNKGAALTTYLSLAGRYSVLMPNTARGGGISRKITQPTDRKRLKKIASELEVPEGMGVILRTAGASRTKAEIKRDFEYLMRLWENVRDLTLRSTAPSLVYEEGSLIKRSIRDLYNKDIDEVLVAGEDSYREAKDFMRMLMPSHAKNVQPYRDPSPVFIRYGVEPQLDAMFSPQVTLKSGGYIVINQTEALVSIDVNSGKSTREHNIEDTALQTNLEAAEEVTRQLRLRDLAGLVVIDFIDMEENKNNRAVERKLKDCLKNDRARIQVGRISHFGLLEMSRQRIRTGVLESSTTPCPHCHGTGMIRSVESVALHVLRSLEDNLLKGATHNLIIRTTAEVALYILNQKRRNLSDLEARFAVDVEVQADSMVNGQLYVLERADPVDRDRIPQPVIPTVQPDTIDLEDDIVEPEVEEEEEVEAREQSEDGDRDRKRRRRRKRRRGGAENGSNDASEARANSGDETASEGDAEAGDEGDDAQRAEGSDEPRRKRRRGRRGGRRGRRNGDENGQLDENGEPIPTAEGEQTESTGADAVEGEAPAAPVDSAESSSEDVVAVAKEAEPAVEAQEAPSEEQAASQDKAVAEPVEASTAVTEEAEPAEQEPEETAVEKIEISTPTPSNEPVAPVVTSERASESEAETKPKRGGWWQRRSFF
ncbi:Rne/Rng family ribonuclease [Roseibium polysiphoniae]|uniref:Ribonuclease E n=1 Tax=Roseibium polysiphoniae TaxID=2571221 RepID=A0ABR9C741_9HYPH|nr:ribonuclease E/G [Roseibium polysiphoniae]MBD8875726.1 Rne/Rng family ribonuclease [Roseibium polysiphoniae]